MGLPATPKLLRHTLLRRTIEIALLAVWGFAPNLACTPLRSEPYTGEGPFDGGGGGPAPGSGGSGSPSPVEGGVLIDAPTNETSAGLDGGAGGPITGPAPGATNLQIGATCTTAGQCTSGFCVDHFCCETACDGKCSSCAGTNTSQKDGTCAPIRAGIDPRNQCEKVTDPCGEDGECDGSGGCRLSGSEVVCSPESCTGGIYTPPRQCDGKGQCAPAFPPASCGAYPCQGSRCNMTCTGDASCAAGNFCDNGTCAAKKANGLACAGAAQCMSGQCVDGVCCENGCQGKCQACSKAKNQQQDGKCLPVKASTDPDDECSASDKSSCGLDGACDGKGACSFWNNGTVCADSSCSNNSQTSQGKCDGKGSCNRPSAKSCAGGLRCRDSSTCLSSCTGNSDCTNGVCFADGSCKSALAVNSSCKNGNECANGVACVGGKCCNVSCDFGKGQVCATNGNSCRLPKGEVCDSGSQCISGGCNLHCAVGDKKGNVCTSSDDCSTIIHGFCELNMEFCYFNNVRDPTTTCLSNSDCVSVTNLVGCAGLKTCD
jgi:hypothetical protein